MSFDALETSRSQGEPVNLYLFTYGQGPKDFFAYCDGEKPVTISVEGKPVTFTPETVERDDVQSKGTLERTPLSVRVPKDSDLASLFRDYPPVSPVALRIFQGHVNDPANEFLVVWTGRVLSFSIQGNFATYVCEDVASSLRRTGLRRHYQYGCPHVLYGPQCRAVRAPAQATVLGVLANAIIVPSTWAPDNRKLKFVNGIAEWRDGFGSTERRTILDVQGGNLILFAGPTRGIAPGLVVDLLLGCNHRVDDCRTLHNNIPNYGGQPFIPIENPIGLKNNFW